MALEVTSKQIYGKISFKNLPKRKLIVSLYVRSALLSFVSSEVDDLGGEYYTFRSNDFECKNPTDSHLHVE